MRGIGNRRLLSRRDFLAGLAGATLLGVAGCAGEESEGLARIVFSHGEDSEIVRDQIRRFNEHNRGTIEVVLRLAPADSSQYFERLRIEFQAGQARRRRHKRRRHLAGPVCRQRLDLRPLRPLHG